MKCLTPSECYNWVSSRGMTDRPYRRSMGPTAQFRIKKSENELTLIAKRVAEVLQSDSELLLVIDDWSSYRDYEMERIMGIRKQAGELRWVIDAPGHELKAIEPELRYRLIHFILSAESGWCAYLYAFPSRLTLLLWEGDIIDLWAEKRGTVKKFEAFLESIKPQIV